jgi:tape measure domain-containing protein
MSARVGALRVTLGANTANYEAGMRRAQTTARRTGRDISTSLAAAQRTATNAFRGIAAAAGVTGLGAAGAGFLRMADAAKSLEAQLRLATRESGSFSRAQADVNRIAAVTRTGLEETASLYATFQRNARELGITQEQSARATETVSKAFQISGASAAEAAGGLRQFLQGVQSGTLRGEELNSVLENAPRLARLLADSLGVTIGQLRAMGQAGELTADKLIHALTDRQFTAGIDAEFRELPVTFDQAMTLVSNAAIETFGAFDRGGQFSSMLASFFADSAEGFSGMASDAETAGASIRSTMSALADVFGPMVSGAERDFGTIASMADQLREAIQAVLGDIQWAYNQYVSVANAVDNFGANVINPAARIFSPGVPPGGGPFARGTRQPATFADDFATRQANDFRARNSNAGIIGAARDQLRPRSSRGAAVSAGGGGGARGGRRRSGGGGGRRAAPRSARVEPSDFASPWLEGESVGEMEARARYWDEIETSVVDVSEHLQTIPSLDEIFTADARDNMLAFAQTFREDLAGGLAQAIVYGKSLGDALVNSLQRVGAALLESQLLSLLGGGGQGGGGFGNILGSVIGSALGVPGIGGGSFSPKFGGGKAAGGPVLGGHSYVVGERGPELLTMGSGGHVTPNGGMGGSKVEIILRDALLDARIAEGAGVTITRAYPAMKADMQASQAQSQRRR